MSQAKAVQRQYGLLWEVEEFLSTEKLLPFINGKYAQPAHQETFQTVDPGSGEVLADVAAPDYNNTRELMQLNTRKGGSNDQCVSSPGFPGGLRL
jgi:hypothetical protein